MKPQAPWAVAGLLLLAGTASSRGEEQRFNVVAEQVRGVPTVDASADTALLLVYVVDDAGDPIDEVEVAVHSAGKPVGAGRTDSRGRLLLSLSVAGPVRVRASEAGFVSSLARSVVLRHGGLTAVVLPLEEAAMQPAYEEPGDEDVQPAPASTKAATTPGPWLEPRAQP